jgi:hypothetical protein
MKDYTEKEFPFNSVLSLNLLIEYWEKAIKAGTVPFGEPLLEHIRRAPELKEPITDKSVLEKHKELISYLMSAVIAPAQTDKELTAATIPFKFESFFETQGFKKTLDLEQIHKSAIINIPGNDMVVGKTIQACLLILQQFYNVRINFDKPILFTIRNPVNGLDKVYKIEIGRQFFEIVSKRELRPIDPKIIKFLTEKVYDVDLWLQYIRPDDFEFRGFMILRMVDVTEQEMVSSIKYDLLEKNAVSRKESFTAIQHKLRSIFGLPEIRLGLAYFDSDNNIILSTDQDRECWKSLADNEHSENNCESYNGSVYERSWMEKRYITVEDLDSYPYKSIVEEALLANGVKNILLAPLIDEGETIGMLELASPNPGELNPITANKVESVLPMFTAAVKRVKEEMITEVRAIIQEECTNIHPVVQWRFLEAGNKVLEKRRRGEAAVFEEITFKDVYPLFGMADIRNSSLERTAAIQKDLLQNLKLAKDLLQKIYVRRKLPVLDETLFKIEAQLEKISYGLASGDENSALEFLKREINPLLLHFEQEDEFKKDIQRYRSQLDPVFGVVYRKRRDFEDSLSMINNMISLYLNEAQAPAQEMFPHYFEKYQTDGVEYTIYLGSSLTKNKQFNTFYLKNFRLWQLLMTCEIEKRMAQLKPELKISLDITQLILVHDQALSIRFRPDEKQFDVDGAYDIRYEIIKKRIDKATVKTTGERLTQPGKIAVIYNQPKVEEEYKRYFEYLAGKNVISNKVEELELEELPGANGLRALRVEVTQMEKISKRSSKDLIRDIESALQLH